MKTEQEQFEECTDDELVAVWNIFQTPCLRTSEAAEKVARQQPIVDKILTARDIPHEIGKRTRKVA